MATWQGVNVNTGTPELPKYDSTGAIPEIYIASLGTTLASGDTVYGPVIQSGLFVQDVKIAVDKLDSAVSPAVTFECGYTNTGTTVVAGFMTTGQTTAQNGGIVSMNVPSALGLTFSNNTTVTATITNAAGTAVAGNMRFLLTSTATP